MKLLREFRSLVLSAEEPTGSKLIEFTEQSLHCLNQHIFSWPQHLDCLQLLLYHSGHTYSRGLDTLRPFDKHSQLLRLLLACV